MERKYNVTLCRRSMGCRQGPAGRKQAMWGGSVITIGGSPVAHVLIHAALSVGTQAVLATAAEVADGFIPLGYYQIKYNTSRVTIYSAVE